MRNDASCSKSTYLADYSIIEDGGAWTTGYSQCGKVDFNNDICKTDIYCDDDGDGNWTNTGQGCQGGWTGTWGQARRACLEYEKDQKCGGTHDDVWGEVCRGNMGFCSGAGDLRAQYYFERSKTEGSTSVFEIDPPSGWRISQGTDPIQSHTFGYGCSGGIIQFGLVQDYGKACTVNPSVGILDEGTDLSVTMRGKAELTPAQEVNLYLIKSDATEIQDTLGDPIIPTGTSPIVSGSEYYYKVDAATLQTNTDGTYNGSISFLGSDLPEDSYYLFCDIAASPGSCSGNPLCSYEGLGGTNACSGFRSCHSGSSPTDNRLLTVQCVSTCDTAACGQEDNCNPGTYCANTCLTTTPNAITNLTTTNANSTLPDVHLNGGNTATFEWDIPANQSESCQFPYDVLIYDRGAYADADAAYAAATSGSPTDIVYESEVYVPTYTYTVDAGVGTTAILAIRARAGCLTGPTGPWVEQDVNFIDSITGTFFDDDDGDGAEYQEFGGGNYCDFIDPLNPTLSSVALPSGSQISGERSISDPTERTEDVGGASTYSLELEYSPSSWSDEKYTVRAAAGAAGYGTDDLICMCGRSTNPAEGHICEYLNIDVPTSDLRFFFSPFDRSFNPWWTAAGGLSFGRTALRSNLPSTSTYLNSLSVSHDGLSTGPSTTAGTPLLGNPGSIGISDGTHSGSYSAFSTDFDGSTYTNTHGEGVQFDTNEYTYENFAKLIDFSSQAEPLSENQTGGSLPAHTQSPLDDGTLVYYREGDLTLAPTSTWTIGSGQKIIVFVTEDLTVSGGDQLIETEPGGFIAFIVAGTITFDKTTGFDVGIEFDGSVSNDPEIGTNAVVEGVFIADGDLTVEAYSDTGGENVLSDKKFIGEGTFVSWSDILLERDYDDEGVARVANQTTPTEVFVFRPDFTANIPEIMKEPKMVWQEVN